MSITNAINFQVTSSNTANTIVQRDSSGNFSSGTITATFNGSLTGSATQANHVSTSTNATFYPLLVSTSANGSNIFNLTTVFSVNSNTGLVQTGNINSSSLTASRIIFTDGIKTYTSSPPAVPQSVMLTNQTSYTANGVLFQNSSGNAFSTTSSLTFNGSDSFSLSSANISSEIISKNTNGGSTAEARIIIDRGNAGSGNASYAQLRYSTNGSAVWEVGIRDTTTDYTLRSLGSSNVLALTTGGTLTLTGGPFVQGNLSDGDKFLLLSNTNAAKIAHSSSWNFQFYSGAETGVGTGGANTGQFNWYTVDASGTNFAQRMTLSNSGNLSLLTGDFDATRSSTGTVLGKLSNTNNSSGTANARFQVITGGNSGGDAYFSATTGGVQDWSFGIDNSDSDSFVICASDTMGTSNKLKISPSTNDVNVVAGHLAINTLGKTVKIAQGSNACSGTGAVMVAGSVTVNTTAVSTGDTVLLMKTASGGTSTTGMPVVTIVNATSFTITGGALDTSTWSWVIIKP